MLCPSCDHQNVEGANRCSACHESLSPFSVEVETGIDSHSQTRAGKAENLVGLIYNSITSWVIGLNMRREIKSELGPNSAKADMLSMNTWMKIRNEEEAKAAEDKPSPR